MRRRLVSDVPLGALLSGGIDSTIVVGLMAQESSEPVRTFTVGVRDPRYDERSAARIAAKAFGTAHEELVVEPDPVELVSRLTSFLDEPLGDEAILPTFLISEVARRHVTVALTGDGGDESFAGYERYAAMGMARRIGAVPVVPEPRSASAAGAPGGEARASLDRVSRGTPPRDGGAPRARALRRADGGLPREAARRPLHAEPHRGDRCSATRFDPARRPARAVESQACSGSTRGPTFPTTCS